MPGIHDNLIGKSVYYLCDLHSSQTSKGVRYNNMFKTYHVTFCSYDVFPELQTYVNSYSMRHDENNLLLTDKIHAIFVELSKLEEILKKPVNDMSNLEKLALFFQYASIPKHRETVNSVIESEEVLRVAADLLMNISQDERERAIFLSRRKYQSDLDSNILTAEARGEARGEARERRRSHESY